MKLNMSSVSIFLGLMKKLYNKLPSTISFLKTNVGGYIFTALICVFFVFYFFKLKILPGYSISEVFSGLGTFATVASGIATVFIGFFTFRSLGEIVKSNEENRQNNQENRVNNQERDRIGSFEKKFTLLLEEHNIYLNRLTESKNTLYQINYILNCSGYESLSIIRGVAKIFVFEGVKYYYSDGLLLVNIDAWVDNGKTRIFYSPTSEEIEEYELNPLVPSGGLYASENAIFYYDYRFDKLIDYNSENNYERFMKIAKDRIESASRIVPKIIIKSNRTSKNILSPYMRIVYHLLKASKENTNNKEDMKKYTNIIRSVIPYDILMLIAINAMYFYKSHNKSIDEVIRWNDLRNDQDEPYYSVFNDYYKYYQLLIDCDFFEHLVMDFSYMLNELKRTRLAKAKFEIKNITCRSDKIIRNGFQYRRSFLFYGDSKCNFYSIYKTITEATMSIGTGILVLLFFFNKDDRIQWEIERIMDDFLFRHRNQTCEGKLKKDIPFQTFQDRTFVNEEKGVVYLAFDFYKLYTSGKLPDIFKK